MAEQNWELDPATLQAKLPMMNIDMVKFVAEMEAEYKKIREQRPQGYSHALRSELKRLKTFECLETYSSWSPEEMAENGFYSTGINSSMQCFCCGLVLCTMSISKTPYVCHQKSRPDCDFIKGIDVGNIPKYEVKVQRGEVVAVERVDAYRSEEFRLESFKDWPFYSKTDPASLAAAGFFFTGVKDRVQCCCCGGALANWEVDDDPWKEHCKWFPECEYVKSKKSSEEIAKYTKSYEGFHAVTAKHYCSEVWLDLEKPTETGNSEVITTIFKYEEVRLDSFKTWPEDAKADPSMLAKAGFFYTGTGDAVQCFQCGTRLIQWKLEDDPWTEHAKHNPSCQLVCCMRAVKDESESTSKLTTSNEAEAADLENTVWSALEGTSSSITDQSPEENIWFLKAKGLFVQLRKTYNSLNFRKIFSLSDSVHTTPDLKSLFAWLPLVSKSLKNEPVHQVSLPVLLRDLSRITVVEGEVGSGKSALLRRIAILWASGSCPVLQRFKLVFYLSLNSLSNGQSLAGAISEELCSTGTHLTEESINDIIYHLKDQVLFLLDDYGAAGSAPKCIQDLIVKNHMNKVSVVIGVQTNRTAAVRQYASSVLTIAAFPVYSAVFILKNLFSHSISLVEGFFVQLGMSQSLQGILKTPLFTIAVCALWVQYPQKNTHNSAICKAYLHYIKLKHLRQSEKMRCMISFCGDLALDGLFDQRFEFSDKDLEDAGIDAEEAIHLGLLSKFTAQMLKPVYKFFHASFQEYLAGKRLSELLESESQEHVEKGCHYLKTIDTFLKIMVHYKFFLLYACSSSALATQKIINHLFRVAESKGFYDSSSENGKYVPHHPELFVLEELLSVVLPMETAQPMGKDFDILKDHFLEFVVGVAYSGNSVSDCAPRILEYLTGKSLNLTASRAFNQFVREYPESLELLSAIKILISGRKKDQCPDLVKMGKILEPHGKPVVEEEFASAYQLLSSVAEKTRADSDNIENFRGMLHRHLPESIGQTFLTAEGKHKMPLLILNVLHVDGIDEKDCKNLMVLFSVSEQVELTLSNSEGFLESIQPALEIYKGIFRKIEVHCTHLSKREEELIVSMSALQSLHLRFRQVPEHLIQNLDTFSHLKELSIDGPNDSKVFDKIPNGFGSLHRMEKLIIKNVTLVEDSSRLARFVQQFSNLQVFHLSCSICPGLADIITSLANCKKLENISFRGSTHCDLDDLPFVSSLPNFKNLKILDLKSQHFAKHEEAACFARALGSLACLEELNLPSGNGVKSTISTVIEQFQHLRHLRILSATLVLVDSNLHELAKAAKEGHLQAIQILDLAANHDITDSGWRNFFLTLDGMPNLKQLTLGRLYTHSLQPGDSTVRAFVQCVSRLRSLMTIVMFGWLLDTEHFTMFNKMKEQHPQSKCLSIMWKWVLPFAPVIQDGAP
ncbi:baculoviral IAP repeat-containing protein 1-like isoform X2 [Acipenser ruthenus]|nr:baculoviral IAP repeat-containing protein 1-like isoform X2 [Acipenser ruthenus]